MVVSVVQGQDFKGAITFRDSGVNDSKMGCVSLDTVGIWGDIILCCAASLSIVWASAVPLATTH